MISRRTAAALHAAFSGARAPAAAFILGSTCHDTGAVVRAGHAACRASMMRSPRHTKWLAMPAVSPPPPAAGVRAGAAYYSLPRARFEPASSGEATNFAREAHAPRGQYRRDFHGAPPQGMPSSISFLYADHRSPAIAGAGMAGAGDGRVICERLCRRPATPARLPYLPIIATVSSADFQRPRSYLFSTCLCARYHTAQGHLSVTQHAIREHAKFRAEPSILPPR